MIATTQSEFRPEDTTNKRQISTLPNVLNVNGIVYIRIPSNEVEVPLLHRYGINGYLAKGEEDKTKIDNYSDEIEKKIVESKLHLDKSVLTSSDVEDIIKEGIKFNDNKELDKYAIFSQIVTEKPSSLIAKLVDLLGQYAYGPNKYIGPEKTGGNGQLLEIVETVPVASEADARARAHDILVEVTDSAEVDSVLPPLARYTATAGRSIGSLINPNIPKNPYRSVTNKDLLKRAGDIEPNPGMAEWRQGYQPDSFIEQQRYNYMLRLRFISEITELKMMRAYDKDHPNYQYHYNRLSEATKLALKEDKSWLPKEYRRLYLLLSGDIEENPGPDDNTPKPDEGPVEFQDRNGRKLKRQLPVNESSEKRVLLCRHVVARRRNNRPRVIVEMILLQSGDIEQNPGPIFRFGDPKAADRLKLLMENPINSTSYLNANNANVYVDQMVYDNLVGQFALRSGLDNQTDVVQMDTNWIEVADNTLELVSGSAVPADGQTQHFQHYAIRNQYMKALLGNGKFGDGLRSALTEGQDFMAAERTNANLVSGDANLGIITRAIKVDYGMYLGCTKLLCYESMKQLLTGQAVDAIVTDRMFRTDPTVNVVTLLNSLFPLTDNPTVGTTAISAYLLDPQLYANMLRGIVPWPQNVNPSDNNVAVVMVPVGITPKALAYITICHLEYPWTIPERAGEEVTLSASGADPIISSTPGGVKGISNYTLIDGPKYIVFYVTAALNVNSITVGDPTTPGYATINKFIPAAPVTVAIRPALVEWWNNGWVGTLLETIEFSAALDYFLRFMDINDWYAAIQTAGSIIRQKASYMPFQLQEGLINLTPGQFYNGSPGTIIPFMDVTVPTTRYGTILGNFQALSQVTAYNRTTNCFGTPIIQTENTFNDSPTPFGPLQVSGYVQDASHTTYYAVHTKMFAKDTLAGTTFLETSRLRYRKILYLIRNVTDVLIQCAHNFYQDVGLAHQDIDGTRAPVQDLRWETFQALSNMQNKMQLASGGWQFLTIPLPYPDDSFLNNDVVSGGTTFFRNDAYGSSPIYLYNHLTNIFDENCYYGNIKYKPTMRMNVFTDHAKWIPDPTGNVVLSGRPVGGIQRIRTTILSTYDIKKPEDEAEAPMRQTAREIYAMFSTTVLHNPSVLNDMTDHTLDLENGGLVITCRPPVVYTKNFLRWWSPDSAGRQYYQIANRGAMGICPPQYPFESDTLLGQRIVLALQDQSLLVNMRRIYSLDGTGSYNFSFTIATTPPTAGRFRRMLTGEEQAESNTGSAPSANTTSMGAQTVEPSGEIKH